MAYIAKDPLIRTAQLAVEGAEGRRLGADGCLVLWMSGGRVVAGGSYGKTRDLCDTYGLRLDRACEAAAQADRSRPPSGGSVVTPPPDRSNR